MKFRLIAFTLVVFASVGLAHAQIGGCVDSPECPTAVLALAGAAGIAVVKKFKK